MATWTWWSALPGSPPVAKAVGCMIASVALLTLNDALLKSLTSGYPVGELLFVRGSTLHDNSADSGGAISISRLSLTLTVTAPTTSCYPMPGGTDSRPSVSPVAVSKSWPDASRRADRRQDLDRTR